MKKSTFLKDFKDFISKGNIIDMAVGVVIGGSFGKIVTGLVNYVINPFVGIFMKGGNLDTVKTVITAAELDAAGEIVTPEVAILWGTWLQTIIDFLITALCIFIVLRIIIKSKAKIEELKKKEEAPAETETPAEPAGPTSEELLIEIRDILKNSKAE